MPSAPDNAEATTSDMQDASSTAAPPRNAFTALMAPREKHNPDRPESKPRPKHHHHRHPIASNSRLALGAYLSQPASSFPPNTIIFQTPDFVAIHDKYPKSTIHTLLLPRSPAHNLLHPLEAFRDDVFLRQVQRQVAYLKKLVAAELQRRLGRYSVQERARQAVLDGADEAQDEDGDEQEPAEEEEGIGDGGPRGSGSGSARGKQKVHSPARPLPPGRDWQADVISGVHAVPSMNHLHIHVLSRDMHGHAMRHRKHYNSFTTGFLVDVMDFPARDGARPEGESQGGPDPEVKFLDKELVCWRCGRGFGNRFKAFKEHLDDEFLSWRSL
ncbi:hypothetical protein E4U21_003475 [Claviceps maximensis]|nr:hypothetical protein E4U21_003475 [Claviceps maximensis]